MLLLMVREVDDQALTMLVFINATSLYLQALNMLILRYFLFNTL